MSKKGENISKYNHGEKSMKDTFIIYADIETFFEKIDTCHSNPEKSLTIKIISKFKPFVDQYNWKEINFPLHKKDWKKFEPNNKSMALNFTRTRQ